MAVTYEWSVFFCNSIYFTFCHLYHRLEIIIVFGFSPAVWINTDREVDFNCVWEENSVGELREKQILESSNICLFSSRLPSHHNVQHRALPCLVISDNQAEETELMI